ncbi:MAG: glycosyltransferase [Hyphomicrobiales bacterium]|nr:MAG: glycosyltransferase [Hyphomicrobiales bacterium]
MKIVTVMAGRQSGGAETYSTDVMLQLHATGVAQVVVMARHAPRFQELQAAGMRMAPEVLDAPFSWLNKRALRSLVEKEKPDILHTWMRRAASLVPGGLSQPVIGWFGGYYEPRHFHRCTHFVGVTEDIVAHMKRNGVPANRAFYIPTFPTILDQPPTPRAALDTPEGAKVFLTLSRLHEKKGLDTFLRALAKTPGAFGWIAGDGPLEGELKALAHTLGLTDRVRFLGWRNDRAALLRAADVCVLPSRYEPFGTVILEAWAAGVPFIAARSAGPEATVRDGVDGLLVPIDDVDALAAAMQRASSDATLRQQLVAEGRASYERSFTPEAVTRQWLQFYGDLVARRI